MDDFTKQKIVWARLSRISKKDFWDFPRFAIDNEGCVVLDSLCFIVGEQLNNIIKVLNSKYAAYYFFMNVAILDNGGMQMRQQYIENIPIPAVGFGDCDLIEDDNAIFKCFGLTNEEIRYIDNYLEKKRIEIENV